MRNEELAQIIKSRYDKIDKELGKVKTILDGNSDPKKGMVFKLDRVVQWSIVHKEEHDKTSKKAWDIVKYIITSILGGIIVIIGNLFIN